MNQSKLKKTSLFVLLAVAVIGGVWELKSHGATDKDAQGGGKGGRFKGQIPTVKVETAIAANVPVYLDGLGTVIAKNTATVASRVSGELQKLDFTEGQIVEQGKLLAELDPRPFEVQLAQAEGQLAADQANLANARHDLERYKTLLSQESVASQKVDAQQALVNQLEGSTKVDLANVANAKLQLTYSRVTAPISGRVGLKQVDIGNQIQASTTGIVVITQVQPINVVFSIPEASMASVLDPVRAGQSLPVEVWDREMKKVLARGSLLTMDNQINVATGTVNLKAEFANTDNALFPNEFVNARMKVGTLQNAVEAPVASVLLGKAGNFVWVMGQDQKVKMRPVKTGPRDGEHIVITDGVKAGEILVTDGVDQLSNDTQVKIVTDAPAPAASDSKPHDNGGKHRKHDTDKAAS